jgi:hypothetical protein
MGSRPSGFQEVGLGLVSQRESLALLSSPAEKANRRGEALPSRLTVPAFSWHTIHMKRTNLVLDEEILREATRVLGAKTYSAAVNQAMQEVIRIRKIQSLPEFFGKGLWQGDLTQMREDKTARPGRAARRR